MSFWLYVCLSWNVFFVSKIKVAHVVLITCLLILKSCFFVSENQGSTCRFDYKFAYTEKLFFVSKIKVAHVVLITSLPILESCFFVSKIKVAHVVLITRLPAYTEKLFFCVKNQGRPCRFDYKIACLYWKVVFCFKNQVLKSWFFVSKFKVTH